MHLQYMILQSSLYVYMFRHDYAILKEETPNKANRIAFM